MFSCEFFEISKNTFLQNTTGRLLLHYPDEYIESSFLHFFHRIGYIHKLAKALSLHSFESFLTFLDPQIFLDLRHNNGHATAVDRNC